MTQKILLIPGLSALLPMADEPSHILALTTSPLILSTGPAEVSKYRRSVFHLSSFVSPSAKPVLSPSIKPVLSAVEGLRTGLIEGLRTGYQDERAPVCVRLGGLRPGRHDERETRSIRLLELSRIAVSVLIMLLVMVLPHSYGADTLNLKPDSLSTSDTLPAVEFSQLPYVASHLLSSEVSKFRTFFSMALRTMEAKDYASTISLLRPLVAREQLAMIYRDIILARAFSYSGQYDSADAVLRGLKQVKSSTWERYIGARRLEIFPFLQISSSKSLDFYREQLVLNHDSEVKTDILLQILKLEGFNGRPGPSDKTLEMLFKGDYMDHRLDSIYQMLDSSLSPGAWPCSMELTLSKYEKNKRKYKKASTRCIYISQACEQKNLIKEAAFLLADLEFSSKNFKKAINLYKAYLTKYGSNTEAMLQIARAYNKHGEQKTARNWYNKFTKRYPEHSKTAEIYWVRGWDKESEGLYDEAREYYQKLIPRFIDHKRGRWANFRIGYCYYKEGKYQEALSYFENSLDQKDGRMEVPAGIFWKGKSLEALGELERAQELFLYLRYHYPFDFYGHLAGKYLRYKGYWLAEETNKYDLHSMTLDSMKSWMSSSFSNFNDSLSPYFVSEYLCLEDLFRLKLDTLARTTFWMLYSDEKENPWFLYQYAWLLDTYWKPGSYRLARRFSYKIYPSKWSDIPLEILKLLFPKPFNDLVVSHCALNGLSPHFVFALMKQESGFDPEIVSFAGAVGLMQIIESTGNNLAKQVGLENFNVYQLKNPEINVKLGTVYLKDLKKIYASNAYLMLANYNAGPAPTKRWKNSHSHKPLEFFVEEISFWETRDYIKKVMANYWTYDLIYSK